MSVKGKVAIVTGAEQGIGRTYAEALATAGARVVALDLTECAETTAAIRDAGATALGLAVDVTDIAAVQAMAARVQAELGSIDVLVNNAALYGALRGGRFDRIDEADWDACMSVNVKGVWNCCRAAVPRMIEGGGGSVINITSLAATYGMPYALHYTTSKAAVIGLTRGLAREVGKRGVRVNAVAPSAVLTPATRSFMGEKYDQALAAIAAGQSIPENLVPDDLVGTILYLASDASRLVTGQTIAVDGGTVFG